MITWIKAGRYTELAKEIALNILKLEGLPEGSAEWLTREKNKQKALDHLIRAETYKDAARIAAGHNVRS